MSHSSIEPINAYSILIVVREIRAVALIFVLPYVAFISKAETCYVFSTMDRRRLVVSVCYIQRCDPNIGCFLVLCSARDSLPSFFPSCLYKLIAASAEASLFGRDQAFLRVDPSLSAFGRVLREKQKKTRHSLSDCSTRPALLETRRSPRITVFIPPGVTLSFPAFRASVHHCQPCLSLFFFFSF